MRQTFPCLLAVLCAISLQAQTQKYGAWFFRQGCSKTTVNGLGLAIFSGGYCELGNRQVTNGIQIDLVGRGIIPPIIYTAIEELEVHRDTLLVLQKINGIAISPGGIGFLGAVINGVNLFGISTMTGKINGISIGGLLNYNLRHNGLAISLINGVDLKMNGLQIGGFNSAQTLHGVQIGCVNFTKKQRGLQIGLFNRSRKLKGIQLGLWNISDKRSLPFLNFQF